MKKYILTSIFFPSWRIGLLTYLLKSNNADLPKLNYFQINNYFLPLYLLNFLINSTSLTILIFILKYLFVWRRNQWNSITSMDISPFFQNKCNTISINNFFVFLRFEEWKELFAFPFIIQTIWFWHESYLFPALLKITERFLLILSIIINHQIFSCHRPFSWNMICRLICAK